MKAVLVIDEMPHKCIQCELLVANQNDEFICNITGNDMPSIDARPNWCPLRPLPRRRKAEVEGIGIFAVQETAWVQGFNECLDEITGEIDADS